MLQCQRGRNLIRGYINNETKHPHNPKTQYLNNLPHLLIRFWLMAASLKGTRVLYLHPQRPSPPPSPHPIPSHSRWFSVEHKISFDYFQFSVSVTKSKHSKHSITLISAFVQMKFWKLYSTCLRLNGISLSFQLKKNDETNLFINNNLTSMHISCFPWKNTQKKKQKKKSSK